MNIITKTATSNLKRNKSRNILIGIAILLTTLLLTIVPTVLLDTIDIEFVAVNKAYPTFHAMFRNVDEKSAEEMQKDERITKVGLREDPAYMVCSNPDVNISMVYCDAKAAKLNRLKLKEGELPEKADEIVVSKHLLKAMGLEGEIGDRITVPFQAVEDGGLGMEQVKEFTITGFSRDSKAAIKKGVYSAMVSKAFTEEIIPEGAHKYRVYFRIAGPERMTTDAIEEQIKEIGAEYKLNATDIVDNGEYLNANYVDPALYSGMAGLMVIIVLAGIITIYSIYYVSMMNKVQEYGKLRAIGATKRQIRKLVFREGFAVALIAIPIGLALGSLASTFIVHGMLDTSTGVSNSLAKYMREAVESSEVTLVKPWILLLAAVVSLAAVYLSLVRPMQVASKISAIEAIRYQGQGSKKKKAKERKGYQELNTRKLTMSNLGRNKKRTVVTIVTLGITGIFFMVVATVLSCMTPESMTTQDIRGDVSISLDFESGNQMHPEKELYKIQQNNPLSEELKEQILAIDGVKEIEVQTMVQAVIQEVLEEGKPMETFPRGIEDGALKELKKYVAEGSLDDAKLKDGKGIILNSEGFLLSQSGKGFHIGDKVHLDIKDGEDSVSREFEIVAITKHAPYSLAGYDICMPSSVLQEFSKNNLTDGYNITAEKGKAAEVTKEVKALAENQEFLDIETYQELYKQAETQIGFMMYGCYGLLLVFGLIGILNLVNTMINSVYVRRRELGMLQAIGLSGKQTVNMLQLEGLFYTAGTLILSLGLGSLLGYLAFLWAREEGLMSIRIYHYPAGPALMLVAVVLLVQLLITYLVNLNFKKSSLIERIRFAE